MTFADVWAAYRAAMNKAKGSEVNPCQAAIAKARLYKLKMWVLIVIGMWKAVIKVLSGEVKQ